jgi:hypothetical protein
MPAPTMTPCLWRHSSKGANLSGRVRMKQCRSFILGDSNGIDASAQQKRSEDLQQFQY